jgi:hypothetical protein
LTIAFREIRNRKVTTTTTTTMIIFLVLSISFLFTTVTILPNIFAATNDKDEEEKEEKEKEEDQENNTEEIDVEKLQEEIADLETQINEDKEEGKEVDTEDLEKLDELQHQLESIDGQHETVDLVSYNISNTGAATTTTTTTTNTSEENEENCNCTEQQQGNDTTIPIEPPIVNTTEPTTPPPPPSGEIQQITIPDNKIKDFVSTGEIVNQDYTTFYNATNVIDNNKLTFWSQYGKQTGFVINLVADTLKKYEVCNVEIFVHNPKQQPYVLTIGPKSVNGILDSAVEKFNFSDNCVKNVNKIAMSFNSPDRYTSLSEIELFGKDLTYVPPPPPTDKPPVIIDGENATKIEINNSNVDVQIKNSTVGFKFGEHEFQVNKNAQVIQK